MNEQEIQNQALALRAEADSFEVVDQATYTRANEFGRAIKEGLKKIDEFCDPVIEAAHKAHKAALDQKKKLSAPFEAAKKVIDGKQIAWYRAEQARVAEERRKAEEEAWKKAEDERLRQAQELQNAGMTEAAADALDQPIVAENIAVAEPELAGGESYREKWCAEVVDLMALVRAVAAGLASPNCLEANMPTLNSMARTLKGTVRIPGVKFVKDISIVRKLA